MATFHGQFNGCEITAGAVHKSTWDTHRNQWEQPVFSSHMFFKNTHLPRLVNVYIAVEIHHAISG